MDNNYFVDSDKLSEAALEKKHRIENDPSSRTNHMEYMEGMERISSDIMEKVLTEMDNYDYSAYTVKDVRAALSHDHCTVEDFKALLSPAAEPFLEKWLNVQDWKLRSISATRFICSHRCILLITARITAFTAALTAITTSAA